jgi:hypothetical protein
MAPLSGRLLAFDVTDTYAASTAQTTEVYEGWTLTRRNLLTDRFMVDEFTVEGSAPDTLDWFLRTGGTLALSVDSQPLDEQPLSSPYTYMKDLRGADTGNTWTAVWAFGNVPEGAAAAPRLLVTMEGAAGTQVARCSAPGAAGHGELWDTLRVRRTAARTRFLAVYQTLDADDADEPVIFAGNTVRIGGHTVELPENADLAPSLR